MSREIPVNRREGEPLVALVDDEDFERVSGHSWHPEPGGATTYAQATIRRNGRKTSIRMHQLLVEAGMVDHVNGNGLDNRRSNLRPASNAQNQQNCTSRRGNSRFKGVCRDIRHNTWKAYITVQGKRINLGTFRDEETAARAYDHAARQHFGEFVCPNFKEDASA